jgi:hypothetical protein
VSETTAQALARQLREHLAAAHNAELKLRRMDYFIQPFSGSRSHAIWHGGGVPGNAKIYKQIEEEI